MGEEERVEQKLQRNFLVRCTVEDLDGDRSTEVMDIVPALDVEDCKDYVVGWLAMRGFTVKNWHTVADADRLRRLVGIVNR